MIVQKPGNHEVRKIALHAAAVPGEWAEKHDARSAVAEINRWHKQKGWTGIGYHFVVMPDGTIGQGRPITKVGAHVLGHNAGSIGILMIESDTIRHVADSPLEYFTPLQVAAVRGIIAVIDSAAPEVEIVGHNQLDRSKLCPGFVVRPIEWKPKR